MSTRPRKPFRVNQVSRADMAKELMKRLERGPSFSGAGPNGQGLPSHLSPEEASRQYRMWVDSWLLDDAKYLLHNDLKDKP